MFSGIPLLHLAPRAAVHRVLGILGIGPDFETLSACAFAGEGPDFFGQVVSDVSLFSIEASSLGDVGVAREAEHVKGQLEAHNKYAVRCEPARTLPERMRSIEWFTAWIGGGRPIPAHVEALHGGQTLFGAQMGG